jgi:hypothetical protein
MRLPERTVRYGRAQIAYFINKLKIVEEEADELVSIFTAALKTSKANYKHKISNRNS